jgi:hypothetical protein
MGRPTTPGREWRQRCQERRRSSPGNVLPPSMYGARACGAAGRICSLHGRTLLGAANAIHEGSCPYFGKMPNCDAQGRAYKKSSFPCLCTKTPPEFLGRLCPAPCQTFLSLWESPQVKLSGTRRAATPNFLLMFARSHATLRNRRRVQTFWASHDARRPAPQTFPRRTLGKNRRRAKTFGQLAKLRLFL